jgi:hypothetical protein
MKQTLPNNLAQVFQSQLLQAYQVRQQRTLSRSTAEKLRVQTTGAGLSELYETLRNASENAEEDLQLMHAVRRFFKRTFLTPDSYPKNAGEELVTELTLAGYLENDSVTLETVQRISRLARNFGLARHKLLAKFPRSTVDSWTLEPMSAAIENELNDHSLNLAFIELAYNYFLGAIDVSQLFDKANQPTSYEATLFVAVQQALLKSDSAAIRLNLLMRYQVPTTRTVDFAKFNLQIDQIFNSPALEKLVHVVSRSGAALRILLKAVNSDDKLALHLSSEKAFLGSYNIAIHASYKAANQTVNRGIIRSVVFLVITKFIIGLAIEVPYDLWLKAAVQWLPLAVNLLLPPLYMIALRLTLMMPDQRNTRALHQEISRILFAPPATKPFIGRQTVRSFGAAYNLIYGLMILAVFVGVGWLLWHFAKFEWIHLAVFFVFISTASFLGFRLSRVIREIEVGAESQTSLTVIRDFIYMPFVAVGRKINETYSKISLVSHFLDMFVELPLKTILGFVRRWGNFLSAKKDEF